MEAKEIKDESGRTAGYEVQVVRAQNLGTEGATDIQIWQSANGWDWIYQDIISQAL